MKYRSTRSSETVTALEALVKGLASDGCQRLFWQLMI